MLSFAYIDQCLAFKIATFCAQSMNNYWMYMGSTGVYTTTFSYTKKDDCIVCSKREIQIQISPDDTLQQLIDKLTQSDAL